MKKIFLLILFCWGILNPALMQGFSDITNGHEHYYAIQFLKEKNIIQGYDDDTFKPNNEINRAEALKIITTGVLGIDVTDQHYETFDLPFIDIEETWYIPYLSECYKREIVSGYFDHTFRPGDTINLAESLKVILEASKVDMENTLVSVNPYPDVFYEAWFAKYVQYAKDKFLIEPKLNGNLEPDRNMTRGDFAEIIYRLMWMKENKKGEFDISLHWPVYENPVSYYKIKYPPDWQIVLDNKSTVIWKKDEQNAQRDYHREYPFSASVNIVLDQNEENLHFEEYFKKISDIFENKNNASTKQFKLFGLYEVLRVNLDFQTEKTTDLYMFLPNNKILIFYSSYGVSGASYFFEKQIIKVQHSLEYSEEGVDTEALLEKVRENINVDGKGRETLDLFSDLVLIETDEIGVGTGPVDYYYSEVADVTLKYERSFDVILAMKKGRTMKF